MSKLLRKLQNQLNPGPITNAHVAMLITDILNTTEIDYANQRMDSLLLLSYAYDSEHQNDDTIQQVMRTYMEDIYSYRKSAMPEIEITPEELLLRARENLLSGTLDFRKHCQDKQLIEKFDQSVWENECEIQANGTLLAMPDESHATFLNYVSMIADNFNSSTNSILPYSPSSHAEKALRGAPFRMIKGEEITPLDLMSKDGEFTASGTHPALAESTLVKNLANEGFGDIKLAKDVIIKIDKKLEIERKNDMSSSPSP